MSKRLQEGGNIGCKNQNITWDLTEFPNVGRIRERSTVSTVCYRGETHTMGLDSTQLLVAHDKT